MKGSTASRFLALALLATLPACGDLFDDGTASSVNAPLQSLDAQFTAAAAAYGVPADLLKSIGYTETRWQMVRGEVEFEGTSPAFGIMALRGERLERGARLAGVTVEQAKKDVSANLRAGAALLRALADEAGIDRANLAAWGPVVATFSGIDGQDGQASYVHEGVYAALSQGVTVDDGAGRALGSIAAQRVAADFPLPSVAAKTAAVDYPGAIWRPSPNYNSRPSGVNPAMIIIHSCEGAYSGCWSWLTNSAAGTSAHYVVNEAGTEVSQLVNESNRAWHIGASYNCSLNGSTDCFRNGTSSNNFTVGIEHGGYASQTSWPTAQISKSAHLSCDITNGWSIPRDVYHVVAHAQLQPANRTDPGSGWPWTSYLNQINAYCTTDIIVDNNNANNNASVASFSASANWTASSGTSGYYGTNYHFANTQAISDPAVFSFYLPTAQTRTVDAWWTAGTNRSATAPFQAYNASGSLLGTVSMNQQANGGQWNVVGTFSFTAGWNSIKLSRWTTSGFVVMADAVRIR